MALQLDLQHKMGVKEYRATYIVSFDLHVFVSAYLLDGYIFVP